jgi:hypothetical protein
MKKSQRFNQLFRALVDAASELVGFVGKDVLPDFFSKVRSGAASTWVVVEPRITAVGCAVAGRAEMIVLRLMRTDWGRMRNRLGAAVPSRRTCLAASAASAACAVLIVGGSVTCFRLMDQGADRIVEVIPKETVKIATGRVAQAAQQAEDSPKVAVALEASGVAKEGDVAPEVVPDSGEPAILSYVRQQGCADDLEMARQHSLQRAWEHREMSTISDIVAQQNAINAAAMEHEARLRAMEASRRASQRFRSSIGGRMAARGVR